MMTMVRMDGALLTKTTRQVLREKCDKIFVHFSRGTIMAVSVLSSGPSARFMA